MIEIIPLDGTQSLQFENYDRLFDYIVESENFKLLRKQLHHQQINWSFIIYEPKQVAALYSYSRDSNNTIREAYEWELPLIEICAGSYKHPTYIVNTPNVDLNYLRQKWCLDFCTYHNFVLRNYAKMCRSHLCSTKESLSCMP